MHFLEELNISSWSDPISESLREQAIEGLEAGKVLFMPCLAFTFQSQEIELFSSDKVDPKRKNISYDPLEDRLGGTLVIGEEREQLKQMLKRYATTTSSFLGHLFPCYTGKLTQARTSFRPTEIFGRKSASVHKDDTRLHVDAFPSSPTNGRRILRIFTNVNPEGKPRVWKVGEPFEEVVKKFVCKVPKPLPGSSLLLQLLKITKERRSTYDHYMLHMHNRMKEDNDYQETVSQEEILFPAGSSWIVFTDQVSHAALAGQYAFEQTFSLPLNGLLKRELSPLGILENFLNRSLIPE